MRIRVFDTEHDAGIYAATLAEQVVTEKERPVLGLATGSTPVPFYEALVNLHNSGLDLSQTVTINLDEYISLPPDHEQSYHRFMHQHLFNHVNIPSSQVFIPNGSADDLQEECTRYDEVIRNNPIDLQILGIGVNGHIGFNEPNHLLIARTHIVNLSDETIASNARFFAEPNHVPRRAITMGVQAILQAKKIILMAFGEAKADIVAKAVKGEVRTDVPASILQLHHDVTVVLDRDSSQLL